MKWRTDGKEWKRKLKLHSVMFQSNAQMPSTWHTDVVSQRAWWHFLSFNQNSFPLCLCCREETKFLRVVKRSLNNWRRKRQKRKNTRNCFSVIFQKFYRSSRFLAALGIYFINFSLKVPIFVVSLSERLMKMIIFKNCSKRELDKNQLKSGRERSRVSERERFPQKIYIEENER